jgi:lipopolysaccharide transport protein LptA
MKSRRAERFGILLLAGLVAAGIPAAWAQQTAPAVTAAATPSAAASSGGQERKDQLTRLPSADDLRPTGPITITANHAEAMQGNSATYSGNVVLSSNTLKMNGDRLELKRGADGQYEVKLFGAPAHVVHTGGGADDPPLDAHARTVNYDSRSGIVDLVGNAYFKRGEDVTTSDTIRYNVINQVYEGNGSVTIVIPPAPGTPSAPAPAPATPSPAPAAPPAASPHP